METNVTTPTAPERPADAEEPEATSTSGQPVNNGQTASEPLSGPPQTDQSQPDKFLPTLFHEYCGPEETPPIFYDLSKRKYLYRNSEKTWLHLNQGDIKKILTAEGFDPRPAPGEALSDVDYELLRIQDGWAVDFTGELAGYKEGIHRVSSKWMLVTRSPKLIQPQHIDWSTLRAVFEAVLRDESHDQLCVFYAWLALAYNSFESGEHMPGQALVMAGPRGCGKSLIQNLITEIFGGRSARPYSYMKGRTDFNSEMLRAEHLMIEDEAPGITEKERDRMGSMIKQLTVNEDQRMHPKGCPAMIVRPCWRLSVTLNEDPEDLRVLPRISESLNDKIHLLLAYKRALPMPTATPSDRVRFRETLSNEIPGLIHFLTREFVIPAAMRSERFGVAHFHHPLLLERLYQSTPEAQLMELIDACVQTPYEGSLIDLHNRLQRGQPAYRQLFSMQTLGNSLHHLSKTSGSRVMKLRSASSNRWSIAIPPPRNLSESSIINEADNC